MTGERAAGRKQAGSREGSKMEVPVGPEKGDLDQWDRDMDPGAIHARERLENGQMQEQGKAVWTANQQNTHRARTVARRKSQKDGEDKRALRIAKRTPGAEPHQVSSSGRAGEQGPRSLRLSRYNTRLLTECLDHQWETLETGA